MEYGSDRLGYIEKTLKALVEELKGKNCLSQNFKFLTEAEQETVLEQKILEFIENY